MITPVKLIGERFEARLSFDLYDWAFAEAISTNEISIESMDIDINMKRRLILNVFLNAERTLLHMIAEKANKED